MRNRLLVLVTTGVIVFTAAAAPAVSQWVYLGADRKLHYSADARDGKAQTWLQAGGNIRMDRIVAQVKGNQQSLANIGYGK